jgi:hypothetical protein
MNLILRMLFADCITRLGTRYDAVVMPDRRNSGDDIDPLKAEQKHARNEIRT